MSVRNVVIAAAALAVAAVFVTRCHNGEIQEWERRVERVQQYAADQEARADTLARVAAAAESRADSLAEAAQESAPEIRERILRVQAATPPELLDNPHIAARDTIIADLREESRRWREAFRAERERANALEEAHARARMALDSVTAVLDDRPSARPWYIPRLGAGPFVGVCTDSRPCSGVGATLSWEIKL